ncbi:Uncharacterized protein PHPALM_31091 [Phytophthora palmivora]|uniref:Integrase catalytic domain-containing protein n=1 Tax=Phytophthora palmivora TaxID=4796 RepID=A0A2P4X3G9_9STRA|nr:Uncharacterized protein PHPALM_31091 [Phytophthora palmivora]
MQLVLKKRRGHYWLDATPVVSTNSICAASSSPNQDKLLVWHMRLDHFNAQAIKKMVELDMVEGMDTLTLADFKKPFRCIACQRAKQKRMTYNRQQEKRRKECYARLMSDVCHVGILTPGGNIYFQLIQDQASRFKWRFLLKDKSEAPQSFVNKKLTSFLTGNGIELLTANAYTPKENCPVEKVIGSLMNKVRAANEASMLIEYLWGKVLGYIVEVDNMSATKALNGITPFEKRFGSKPQVKDLHVFIISQEERSSKLDMLADPGVSLGYAKTSLGYRILDLCTGKLIERRDVVFYGDLAADHNYLQNLTDKTYSNAEIERPDHIEFASLPVSYVHMPVVPQDESSDDGEQNLTSCADEMERLQWE